MTVADLLSALSELRAGRLTVEQLVAACSAWSNQPTRPLSEFLKTAPVPLAEPTGEFPAPTVTQAQVSTRPADPDAPPGPATAGPFVPQRLHARGGMGRVWAARDALGREVAFKDLPPGRPADAAARFAREARVTGRLEHPGIVPVYAAGRKADGSPFYVMRMIRGRTLTEVIRDAHARPVPGHLREFLTAFVGVCDAVAFAHCKGIIHRDLKPANVMVGNFGEMVVMDWGLARETNAADRETQSGAVMGTPAYMAPEQASGATDDQDERTDVYGLGGILYELLAGQPPFAGRSKSDLLDPNRGAPVSPRSVNSSVPPALDAICLKAMQARPAARYQTAQALAADVRRWLADEPVTARRDPFVDRARRWARRNRTLVSTAAGVGIVALIGLAVGLAAVSRVNAQLDTANTKLTSANTDLETAKANLEKSNGELAKKNTELVAARKSAEQKKTEAEHARDQAQRVAQFLFETLRRPDPAQDGRTLTVAQLLSQAEEKLDRERGIDPATRAFLLNAIGQTYDGLGLPADAKRVFERVRELKRPGAGEDESPDVTVNTAVSLHRTGESARAIEMLEELLPKARRRFGPDDPRTLVVTTNLGNILVESGRPKDAIPLLEDARRGWAKADPNDLRALIAPSDLGNALRAAGRAKEAVPMLEAARKRILEKFEPDHPAALTVTNNLAAAYRDTGRVKEAVPLMENVLKRSRDRQGEDHPDALSRANNLATYLGEAGRTDEAIALYEDTLKRQRAVRGLGPDHPDTLMTARNLGLTLAEAGRVVDGIPYLEDVERRLAKTNSPKARDAAVALAHALWAAAQTDRAIELCERVRSDLQGDDPVAIEAGVQLALAYRSAGKWDKAKPLLLDYLVFARRVNGEKSDKAAEAMGWMAECLLRLGDAEGAEPLARESLDLQAKADDWRAFAAKSLLGEVLLARKKPNDAEPLLKDGYDGLKARQAATRWDRKDQLPLAAGRMVKLYEALGEKDKAAEWKKVEEQERKDAGIH